MCFIDSAKGTGAYGRAVNMPILPYVFQIHSFHDFSLPLYLFLCILSLIYFTIFNAMRKAPITAAPMAKASAALSLSPSGSAKNAAI